MKNFTKKLTLLIALATSFSQTMPFNFTKHATAKNAGIAAGVALIIGAAYISYRWFIQPAQTKTTKAQDFDAQTQEENNDYLKYIATHTPSTEPKIQNEENDSYQKYLSAHSRK